jgi:hypothetical protein|nr:MAG TPA: Ig-like domain protein [Caudoviricetes sp.]
MAIQTVRAQVNGTWHTLTYNDGTQSWEATITAPGATSFNQPNGYYNVTVEATNTAGTQATADGSTIDGLQLVVKETVAPVITITSPTNGARVTNSNQPVTFTVIDEAGGSGVNLNSVVVKLDNNQVSVGEVTHSAVTNGYSFTYTAASPLKDGSHTVSVDASDNDGNAAAQKSTTFTVDTVAPSLNVTSPTDGLITNNASITVTGTTNDTTSSPVTVTIQLNSVDQGAVTVESSGAFSKTITLANGANAIVVTSTDQAGKSTSVTINVTLDTSVPQIVSATITPNPVDAGQTMVISVQITG